MRSHVDIISDIYKVLQDKGLDYEFKALKNEVSLQLNSTELIGEVGSVLLKMNQKQELKDSIGALIIEFSNCAVRKE
jgi:hypothetical protein